MKQGHKMSGNECDSDEDYSEEDCGYADYYNTGEDCDIEQIDLSKTDPEYFVFECFSVEEVERLLNESVETLSNSLQITPSLAKVLLHAHFWQIQEIVGKHRGGASQLLVLSKVKPPHPPDTSQAQPQQSWLQCCPVCLSAHSSDKFSSLASMWSPFL